MLGMNLFNKLIKKSRRWEKKTQLAFFKRTSQFLLEKKKRLIFSRFEALAIELPANSVKYLEKKFIWVCWFQGIEQAPLLVKRCIESVQRQAGDAQVVILTKETIANYVTLPAHIISKHQQGKICHAHYSDILRCSLLAQYGGVWVDATLYMTRPFPDSFFTHEFSSLRFDGPSAEEAIGKGDWVVYLLAAQPGCKLVTTLRDMLFRYWQENDELIEYFLTDYAILYCTEHYQVFKGLINAQPIIGNQRFLIRQFMNQPVNSQTLEALGQDPVGIYKLSHKERYQEMKGGVLTLYGEILADTFSLPETARK